MKSYRVESVEFQGKRYSKCSAGIDEELNQAEFLHAKGLGRKKLVSVGKLSYDDGTEIRVEGRAIKTGSWVIVASSETDAAEITKLLLRPKEARAKLQQNLLNLENSVSSFLKLREEGIQFLINFLVDPRGVSFSLSSSWASLSMGPVEEFLNIQAMNLSSALQGVTSAVAALVGKVGEESVEKIYAFIYAAAILQNSVLTGGDSRGAAEAMLGELGIGPPPGGGGDPKGMSERLLQIAHPMLFTSGQQSAPKN